MMKHLILIYVLTLSLFGRSQTGKIGACGSVHELFVKAPGVSKVYTGKPEFTRTSPVFFGDTFLNKNKESSCLTPFNKESNFNHYAIKFKILPWISIPSGSGINPSFGLEFGFCKNHSIGIDLFYNQYSFSSGDKFDSTSMQYLPKPRVVNKDKAIFLNYRFYLSFQGLRKREVTAFYVGSFFRYGNLRFKYDEGYVEKSSIIKEDHYSFGVMYGLIHQLACFQHGRQINIDSYFGIYAKQKVQFIEYRDFQNNLVQEKDYPVGVGIRIGLSFSFTGRR